jgi:hypothetical protein
MQKQNPEVGMRGLNGAPRGEENRYFLTCRTAILYVWLLPHSSTELLEFWLPYLAIYQKEERGKKHVFSLQRH